MRIGIDFDNTIAGYDRVFREVAAEWGLLPAGFVGGKQAVREALRARPGGEREWMRLQGRVYGKYMARAEPVAGVEAVLRRWRRCGAALFVVSHKSRYGHFDPERIDLREAALGWLTERGLFGPGGLDPARVFFEETREAKVARIAALALDHFIDDLPEVFAEPAFPAGVRRHLLATAGAAEVPAGVAVYRGWEELGDALCAA